MSQQTFPGRCYPLGATVCPNGVNFSVYSRNAVAVELLIFDDVDSAKPERSILLDPNENNTFSYWHILVPGLTAGQLYGYRVYGPLAPDQGYRFDGTKVLLDPYARCVAVGKNYSRDAAIHPGDNAAYAMKSVIVDPVAFDWEEDRPLRYSYTRSVIYEMHVGGFTRHPNSGVDQEKRGTYAGMIEKIPYLKELGITAVELLPVQHFDIQDAPEGLNNYWGYSPAAFFAPHSGYCSCTDALSPVIEFRTMVKALHREGIEVILDVVFNHTAEGDHRGPLLSLRGFENRAYYILERNPAYYSNYSGTGNTLDANHSVVRRLIMDCLRYWVSEMHVDGFRFDLASVMARDGNGRPLQNPPILWEIESDPVLAGTKIIAEAWDAAGLYQVGSFIGYKWAEWNGLFRDDVRRFLRGDTGMVKTLAERITASPDIYEQSNVSQISSYDLSWLAGREPSRSINFITCHDGFTLNDLVSYNTKHNEANGEANRDGHNVNFSWNCGFEGPTSDGAIETLRLRQIKNFLTIVLFSQGTPMLQMGDEVRRTQSGNNNAYCQDNETSWFDWDKLTHNADLLHFVTCLIRFNLKCEIFQEERFWTASQGDEGPNITWHGVRLGQPDWAAHSHSLAFELKHPGACEHMHVILNAYREPLSFELPPLTDKEYWVRLIDTSLQSPNDFTEVDIAPAVTEKRYPTEGHSVVVLIALKNQATSTA